MTPAVLDTNIGTPLARRLLDLQANVARTRVQHQIGAARHRRLPADLERVDRDHGVRPGEPGELHGEQADGAHAEHRDCVADTNVPVADRTEGKVGRVQAHCGLPGHPVGQYPHTFNRPDVLLPERAMTEDVLPELEVSHAVAQLADLADADVAEPDGEAEHRLFGPEHLILGVVGAAGSGVALEAGHLTAGLGGSEQGLDADLARLKLGGLVLPEGDLLPWRGRSALSAYDYFPSPQWLQDSSSRQSPVQRSNA